jgi:hypothetical protein
MPGERGRRGDGVVQVFQAVEFKWSNLRNPLPGRGRGGFKNDAGSSIQGAMIHRIYSLINLYFLLSGGRAGVQEGAVLNFYPPQTPPAEGIN